MKNSFNIISVVSPSVFGGETKNQDRVTFDSQTLTACVCDGVTSSPHSEGAASIVSEFAPVIFNSKTANLKTLSDLLVSKRKTAIDVGVTVDASMPDTMKRVVLDATQHKLRYSYQTTLVAAKFLPSENYINVRTVSCGDSGLFTFSSNGELLTTNMLNAEGHIGKIDQSSGKKIPFGPGSELVTKVIGTLSDYPNLVKQSKKLNPNNWLLCKPVCSRNSNEGKPESEKTAKLWLRPTDLLLAPKYLATKPLDPQYQDFRSLPFSKLIRRITSSHIDGLEFHLDLQGNTTNVLPDHYYTGQWEYEEEKFPTDTSFLLCSDGFYRRFPKSDQMWRWLRTNQKKLSLEKQKEELMFDLHDQLNQKSGDDDISFIWITPKKLT